MRRHLAAILRLALPVLILSLSGWAANIKLYLKDGNFHLVREYQVQPDRIRYYSVERTDWEEIPLDMVDLKRTESEAAARKAELDKDAKVLSEEDAAERAVQKEAMRIPQDPGVYWVDGSQTKVMKAAESVVHSNKRREVLKMLSPIPAITGKATLEVDGAHSQNVFSNPEQEFYIQLSETERFGIAKLTSKNGVRIVENITYVPISKETVEEPTMVDIFRQQITADGLYKIWPKEKLEPGEYAVVEYTEGKVNIQTWDFQIKAK
jgi:hypothetical protein